MSKVSRLMTMYVLRAISPYLIFSWLLLTVILFVQQAGRHAEIFFGNRIPPDLLWQMTWALLPNVIAFTAPMAVLVGVIIGLSRLRSDSELVAMRAAGVGTWQILVPILMVGILICGFSFLINLKGIPFAAQIVRRVGIKAALAKLESPIEPGQFNTDITDYVIYVREGDLASGQWHDVFVFNENKDKTQARIITADVGRIDTSEEDSELVLENAEVTTIPATNTQTGFAHEEVKNVRFAIPTKRKELIERLGKVQEFPEEMGLNELAAYAQTKTGKDKIEADLLWQRRLTLSLTPLLFAFLGASLSLRFNRGGRGWGAAFALLVLLGYYLLALFGEQLARTGAIPTFIGGAIPMICALAIGIWAIKAKQGRSLLSRIDLSSLKFWSTGENGSAAKKHSRLFTSWRSGLMDFDIFSNLLKYFFLTLGFLVIIYLIFTVFELWKFVIGLDNGMSLLGQYLFYLFPYVFLQLIPSTLMIAILATYVIKSRSNEVVSWIAAGQSVFRLLVPCLFLMLVVGWLTWEIQERVVPFTNRQQDLLRSQIRGGMASFNKEGHYWVAGRTRLYSFTASDDLSTERGKDLTVYEFDESGSKLSRILKSPTASRKDGGIMLEGQVQSVSWASDKVNVESFTMPASSALAETENPFEQIETKPAHLSAAETLERIRLSESQMERRNLEVNLQRKYSAPFLPLVIMLFTAPFALSLGRKGRVITVGLAIGVWLVFMGLSNTFEQFGISGQLSAKLAVWNPLILFSILGAYLLTRVRT